MADSRADDCIREHEQLASRRGVLESHWREIAERVRPNQNMFQQMQRAEGDKRNERVFDDTAPLALPKFAAAVISMAFPATQRYHTLTAHDDKLNKVKAVRAYCEEVTDMLFRVRYSASANFQSQSGETILDIGAFGNGVLFIDDVLGVGIRYKSFPLAETYFAENAHGMVDTLHRKFEMTAYQAATKFGESKLPQKIKNALQKDKYQKFWFLHCVQPNPNVDPKRKDFRGWKYWSCYTSIEERAFIDEGGFRVFPFAVPRFETAPGETYGRGPASKVLPTIKMLNEMEKTVIRSAQKVVDPPVMLAEDGSLQTFNVRPNALNHGYVDPNGRPLAIPFNSGGRVDVGLDIQNQRREAINDAFFVTLFRILVEEPQITATEAMLRAQEKGQLLAPTMGRIQSELLGPQIARELDILAYAGVLPDMPPELMEAGGDVKIEYQSPLNLAQQAGAGVGIMNTIQAVAPLAQIDPTVMMVFKSVEIARELAKINGVPEKVMNSEEEIAAMKEQQAQAQQAQQLLAAAPVAASAAKDFAQAQSMAGSSPNQQLPAIMPQGA